MSVLHVQRVSLLVVHTNRGDPCRRIYTVLEPLSGKVLFELDAIDDQHSKLDEWAVVNAAQEFTWRGDRIAK